MSLTGKTSIRPRNDIIEYWRDVHLDDRLCFTMPGKKLFQVKRQVLIT